jgi:N-acetylglucosaminyldiphosphoundecaprenol N-acetyl-beta-D-mannosaminyltransferase
LKARQELEPSLASDSPEIPSRDVLGVRVDSTTYQGASELIASWASARECRYVCVANVNNVMEAHDDPVYMALMNDADLVTSDGMPLVWALRMQGIAGAERVYGPTLTAEFCAEAERRGIRVGFFGGSPEVLSAMIDEIKRRWPQLRIAYHESPPFRPLSAEEDSAVISAINASGAQVLFVGLGAPKQERWMADHAGSVRAVMVGVGAAFDYLAGAKRQAPMLAQRAGLEWLFRLVTEPRRLWKRYAKHNPRFVFLFARQLLQRRRRSKETLQMTGGEAGR